MRLTLLLLLATAGSLLAEPPASTAPIAPIARLLPPPGIELPAEEKQSLAAELAEAEKAWATVASHPLSADAEVYLKAVAFALENGEFYKPEHAKTARALLKTARSRTADLAAGRTPWATQTGSVVRGFRSRLDGSPQPYGVEVPPGHDFSRPARVYLWLHGRGDQATDMHFIAEREKKGSQFKPPVGTLIVHPFGRHCVGYKSAGETDVLEALAHAQARYRTDADRVALMGFSMGGAGAWHLGAHHTDAWAVIHAGAGFVDVQRYTGADPAKTPPWERTLWGLYDVPDYARNLLNRPIVAYSGEVDKQKAAADIMEATLMAEGMPLPHFIGPKMGHKYDPAVQKQVQAFIDAALAKGRDTAPREIHFQTRTLRYPGFAWLRLEELGQHWQDARVDAVLVGDTLRVTTRNVQAFSVKDSVPFKSVEIDGSPVPESIRHWVRLAGRWQGLPPDYGRGYFRKTPGLQGPMDDALLDPFLVVLPSKPCASPAVQRWVDFESARFAKQWRELFRGRLRVKKDTDVTPDDVKNFHLVLWGDTAGNSALARLADRLPVGWKDGAVTVGARSFPAASHVPAFIHPNPANPARYVVVNNGCSFREGHCKTNALQNPKLPDWAVFDITRDPDATSAGTVVAADFFDEGWKVK